jgi:hypothetical protein
MEQFLSSERAQGIDTSTRGTDRCIVGQYVLRCCYFDTSEAPVSHRFAQYMLRVAAIGVQGRRIRTVATSPTAGISFAAHVWMHIP